MSTQLLSIVDVAVVGYGSASQLAGASAGAGLVVGTAVFGMGVMLAVDPFAAQALGARKPAVAKAYLEGGLCAAVLLGLMLIGPPMLLASGLTRLGLSEDSQAQALQYLYGRAMSAPLMLASTVLRSFLQVHGRGLAVVWSVIVANIINLLGDLLLFFGDGGLQRVGLPPLGLGQGWGVFGIGLTSTIASLSQLIVLWFSLPVRAYPRLRIPEILALWRVGSSVGMQRVAEIGVFVLIGLLSGHFGPVLQSAHYAAMQVVTSAFTLALAIGHAAAVRIGLALGAGERARSRQAATVALTCVSLAMALCGTGMWGFRELIASLLTHHPAQIAATVQLLEIGATFQVVDGIQAVAASMLRGTGNTRAAFLITVSCHWLVGLPVGIVLSFYLHSGAQGLWWGLTVAFALASGLLIQVLRRDLHESKSLLDESRSYAKPGFGSKLARTASLKTKVDPL
jgi:MATE family multidrug resistance protein